jgi:hypothetical protein
LDLLVDGLRTAVARWRREPAHGEIVAAALCDWHSARTALHAHARFGAEGCQRQTLFRDADLEILLLCWEPGQATPVHDHDGQSGWLTVLDGRLVSHEFERVGGPEHLSHVRRESPLGPGSLVLRPRGSHRLEPGVTVCEAAAPETIHRVGSDGGRALSLHVYTRPLDSLLVFDELAGSCRRVRLAA